ncbi:hypothetical protein NUU61_000903 [Penicillium alfredii]|uniref:N-acetyltransferase domain-containing protein n=1 Tax=Penicillium alfredii TaxID=1506179 RepID=A0A9W9GAX5_9EURO|nr:uncharacterized protein NUU61_000903 [Penicillium alfredii]KAJ5115144.1 hypothetical protein NUU61_000903 [Penicillium alfredii]
MASGNLHFRIATPEYAEPIQQLVQCAFRAEDSRQGWTADMELSARFRVEVKQVLATISNPDSAILMATDNNGTLVGSIEISKRGIDRARFSMLAVDQSHQRQGLGRQVLGHAEEYCQRVWGARIGELNALSTRQELILWYVRRGYRKTGELRPFPREEFNGLELPDDMCFVELEKDLSAAADSEDAF